MSDSIEDLIEPVIAMAVIAGKTIKEVFRSGFDVEIKSDNSPVTIADKQSNQIILEALAKLPQSYPALSEEEEMVNYATRSAWQSCWLVDPLDGTRDFVEKKNGFCVNIGLVIDSKMALGIVHVPMQNKTYYACRGQGAFVINEDGSRHAIHVASWRGQRPFKIATSRSHPSGILPKFLNQIGEHETVQLGSAIKMCMVATGEVDFYPRFGPTWEWDTAAAQCIVEEAGGRLTDFDFEPLKYNSEESLKNPPFIACGDVGDEGLTKIIQAYEKSKLEMQKNV